MSAARSNILVASETPRRWLEIGQAREAMGRLEDAVRAYDRCIAASEPAADPESCRQAALGWMNRGNALQKLMTGSSLTEAVIAYDHAIERLTTLPFEGDPALRNTLGAAWLNRGRALQLVRESTHLAEAIVSDERALALLSTLPLDASPAYRRNLAGAGVNLADALLDAACPDRAMRARMAARTVLGDVAGRETTDLELADLSFKARRALVAAIDGLLRDETARGDIDRASLIGEASDAIDDGMALARHWAARGATSLRLLTERLFRFGAQLYRVHQPHFLVEFLLENVGPHAAFETDDRFRAIAIAELKQAGAALRAPRLLLAGDPATEACRVQAQEVAHALSLLDRDVAPRAADVPAALPNFPHP